MNSQQINFFLTDLDQQILEVILQDNCEFTLIDSISRGGQVGSIPTFRIQRPGEERLKIYVVRTADLGNIRFNEVPSQRYSVVDSVRSNAIEFVRCYQDGKTIKRRRLYVVNKFYENQNLIEKSKEFREWSSSIVKTVRRSLIKDKNSFFYFGRNYLEMLKAGDMCSD